MVQTEWRPNPFTAPKRYVKPRKSNRKSPVFSADSRIRRQEASILDALRQYPTRYALMHEIKSFVDSYLKTDMDSRKIEAVIRRHGAITVPLDIELKAMFEGRLRSGVKNAWDLMNL